MSLAETGDVEQNALSSEAKETGFAEALAQATSFCFQDMQHGRFAAELRAAAAQAGTEVS
jgi:senataxin